MILIFPPNDFAINGSAIAGMSISNNKRNNSLFHNIGMRKKKKKIIVSYRAGKDG